MLWNSEILQIPRSLQNMMQITIHQGEPNIVYNSVYKYLSAKANTADPLQNPSSPLSLQQGN